MARRSNRTRGTKRDNLGRSLKAMKMKPLANAVRGGLGIEESIKYYFDGSTMYATIPDWTPNGLPFSVEVSAVPLTLGDADRRVLTGVPYLGRYVSGATTQARYRDVNNGLASFSNLGDATVGEALTLKMTHTGEGVSASAILSDTLPTVAGPEYNLWRTVGAQGTGANPWHGPIYNLRLTDNSPIQDTTACFGDGTRYVELENPIVLEGDFEIEFDWIRQELTGTAYFDVLAEADGLYTNHRLRVFDTGHANANGVQIIQGTTANTFGGALDNIAIGQHCKVKVVSTSASTEVFVDGVSTGPQIANTKNASFGVVGVGQYSLPANSALQNVIIRDLTNNLTWEYKLDEGSGTAANNTGLTTQGNYLGQPLWDRATLDGNGARYIEIPEFSIGANEEYRIRLDIVEPGFATNYRLLGTEDGTNSLLLSSNSNIAIIASGETKTGISSRAAVTEGEHYTLEVVRDSGGVVSFFINEEQVGSASGSTAALIIDRLMRADAVNLISPIGNVQLENLTTGDYVEYRIDEGSGTTVKAYDKAGNEIGLGDELVVNGGFDADNDWIKGAGWTISGGTANKVAGAGAYIIQEQSNCEAGKFYEATFTVLNYVAGSIRPCVSSGSVNGTLVSANGTYTERLVATTAGDFRLLAGSTFEGSIDNVSFKEVTEGTITPDAAWTQQPEYSNNGAWTPDTDWQYVPDNSRTYPMNQAADRHKPGYFACFDGNGDRLESADATIVNYDPDSWQYLP